MVSLINHTSADDCRSSLQHVNPVTRAKIREAIDELNRALVDETKNRDRSSVVKMLKAKINKLKKVKPID